MLTAVGLVGGLAVVALALILGARPAPGATTPAMATVARMPSGLPSEGFVLGRADAPVTIDLYEDFQCPACASWGRTVFPNLAANELAAGTAKVVFHDLAFLGPESTDAGRAAYAAGQQGRFWDMWATLYANQSVENSGAFSRDRLVAMAAGLGLDGPRFAADMESPAAHAAVAGSQADGARAGVTSTPTLVIAGHVYIGIQPYADMAAAIATAAAQ